jgi:hypothetical protein
LEFANAANLFENVELSRLDPIFFKNSGSSGSTFFFPMLCRLNPFFQVGPKLSENPAFRFFLHFWVEPAQPTMAFLTFEFGTSPG